MTDRIFITGGSGSLGRALTKHFLSTTDAVVVCYSRDPHKQNALLAEVGNHPNLRLVIGDVRDKERLIFAMRGSTAVLHLAALKHVDVGEYNSTEFIATNIDGTKNVAEAAIVNHVGKCLFTSTDKSVSSFNLYGRTKAVAERLWVRMNTSGHGDTKFSVVRYGNVFDSAGSVIQVWNQIKASGGQIGVREPEPTRFICFLRWGVNWVNDSLSMMRGGEIFVPADLRAVSMHDVAEQFAPRDTWQIGPLQGGEKQHEVLLAPEEIASTVRVGNFYIVNPDAPQWAYESWVGGEPPPSYSSADAQRLCGSGFMSLYNQIVGTK